MEGTSANGDRPAGPTHYDVLGISSDASQDGVHRAFSSLLAQFRADPSPEMQERVRQARIAYGVLSKEESRSLYNAELNLTRPPQRRWSKYYLQEEEEGLMFWTGAAMFGVVALWGFAREYLLLKLIQWPPRMVYRAINALLVRNRSGEIAEEMAPKNAQGAAASDHPQPEP